MNALLHFLQETIAEVHAVLDPQGRQLSVRVHLTRGVSASVNFMKNWSMSSVPDIAC